MRGSCVRFTAWPLLRALSERGGQLGRRFPVAQVAGQQGAASVLFVRRGGKGPGPSFLALGSGTGPTGC
jgi:hypothetical protein